MINQSIKYQPLESHDFEDDDDADDDHKKAESSSVKNVPYLMQIHWSLKLLLVIFILIQLLYVGHYSVNDVFHRNTSQLQSGGGVSKIKSKSDNLLWNIEKPTKKVQQITTKTTNRENSLGQSIFIPTPFNNNNNNNVSTQHNVKSVQSTTHAYTDTAVTLTSTTSVIVGQDEIKEIQFGNLSDATISNETNTNAYTQTHINGVESNSNAETTTNTITSLVTSNVSANDDADDRNYNDADAKDFIKNQQTNENDLKQNKTAHETQNLIKNNWSISDYTTKTTTKTSTTTTATTTTTVISTANPSLITNAATTAFKQWMTTIAPPPSTWSVTDYHHHHPPTTTTSTTTKPKINQTISSGKKNVPDKRQYFINTSTCHVPYIDPFTPGVRKIFKPSHESGCTKDDAIVGVHFDTTKSQYILHINYTVAKKFVAPSSEEKLRDDLHCCYREIWRSGSWQYADRKFKMLPCTNFHQDFVVPQRIEGVITECSWKSKNKVLQQDAFAFIQVKKESASAGPSPSNRSDLNGPHNLGVLMIGIDSLSRINFRRSMPETLKYLNSNGWYELQGYNKVGDNTLPNLMPLLAGITRATTSSQCNPLTVGGLDKCNFIWRNFKEHGFKTAYAEDTSIISTFNYKAKGFLKPPTDYYYRPILLATEKTLKTRKKAGLYYCIGRKQAGEYIYDYGLEFVTRFMNQSNFGFFWTNSFSHNSFDTAATMDNRMVEYFKDIKSKGILEQSVVMFFSDHGCRWGPLLQLPEGFLEERLPFMFLSLPTWFKSKYPEYERNLQMNQKRLITPFDIHMTLQELVQVAAPKYQVVQAPDCPNALSIFKDIPENRTCLDACIPEAWCTCTPFMIASVKDRVVSRVTHLILDEMNRYIAKKNLTTLCSELKLHNITKAKRSDEGVIQQGKSIIYVIDFITNPKTDPLTEFSATANYDPEKNKIHVVVEDIARHSKYENTAKCTDDKQAKMYCICKDSLKS